MVIIRKMSGATTMVVVHKEMYLGVYLQCLRGSSSAKKKILKDSTLCNMFGEVRQQAQSRAGAM